MSSTLEIHLRRIRNETEDELAQIELAIQRCEATISRLRTNKNTYNPRVVIERNETELARFQEEKRAHELKLEQIESEAYLDTLKQELEHNREVIAQKSAHTKKRKEAAASQQVMTTTAASFTKKRPMGRREWEPSYERDFKYAEKQYHRDSSSLPDYLYDKIQNMPNNMGYVWKDIWFFGARAPEQTTEYTLFEKRYNQFLVHVFNRNTHMYTLYEKDQSGRRRFISRAPMKKRTGSLGIAQLIENRL